MISFNESLTVLNRMVDEAGCYIIGIGIEEINSFLIDGTSVPSRTLRNKTISSSVQTKKLSLIPIPIK